MHMRDDFEVYDPLLDPFLTEDTEGEETPADDIDGDE